MEDTRPKNTLFTLISTSQSEMARTRGPILRVQLLPISVVVELPNHQLQRIVARRAVGIEARVPEVAEPVREKPSKTLICCGYSGSHHFMVILSSSGIHWPLRSCTGFGGTNTSSS